MLTDIEGSTRLWQHDADAMSEALSRHDTILREAIETHDGHVFKTVGDAFCSAFHAPMDALEAAVAAQRALSAQTWPTEVPIRVRMALHAGVVEARDGDYFGQPLNRCARIESVGHGGQMLASSTVHDLVRDTLPEDLSLRDLGQHRLRDLDRPARIFQVHYADLPAEFPALKSLDNAPNNLPIRNDRFVGRERELLEVERRLGASRLLTLTGSGGSGKTRLSQQVGADMLDVYSDGIWFVDLSTLTDPSLIGQTVSTVMGVRELPGQLLEQTLLERLANRQALLILDNCEHVIDEAARLIERILSSCPRVTVLATSQEVLNLAGEDVWPVPPLEVPDPADVRSMSLEQLTAFGSVQLFVDRSLMVKPTFVVTSDNAAAVAEICHRLDGIPLAIELAAVRTKVLSPEMIAQRLDQRFRLLTGGRRTAQRRQQTLRAAVEWSHDLLEEQEQALLRRLSVFAGGWTVEAAEAICADGEVVESWEVLELLSSLVDKSLVVVGQSDRLRQRLYESIRAYALERLVEAGESASLEAAHAEHYLALAEAAEPELNGADQASWLQRLDAEHVNLRAALAWSYRMGQIEPGLSAAGALWRYWFVRGRYGEGRAQIEELLSAAGPSTSSKTRARALHGAGTLAIYQSDYARARSMLGEAREIWGDLGDAAGAARSLNNLASIAYVERDYESARERYLESLVEIRSTEDELSEAHTLSNLGLVAAELGDCPEALHFLEQALALCRRHGDRGGIATNEAHVAAIHVATGEYERARQLAEESRATFEALDNRPALAATHRLLGQVDHEIGDLAAAGVHYRRSLQLGRELDSPQEISEPLRYLGRLALDLGNFETARAWFEEALPYQEHVDDKRGISDAHNGIGEILLEEGRLVEAAEMLRRSLVTRRDIRHRFMIVESLESLARLAVRMNRPGRALTLAGAADASRDASGTPRSPSRSVRFEADRRHARAQLSEERAAAAELAGRALRLEDAIDLALQEGAD